ncbi:MAG TPA: hypothetical protein PK696_04790 [bacterium]|nr:hypothetical protein [bacterium]
MVTPELIEEIRRGYALRWHGPHGVCHWARVRETALRLALITGADAEVVELFSVFHDARRENEGTDPEHGPRGALFAAALRGRMYELSDAQFSLLHVACADHTRMLTHGDVTVQTCWDADRLDLGRVNITPRPEYLSTAAARDPEFIAWAHSRSLRFTVPEIVHRGWVRG